MVVFSNFWVCQHNPEVCSGHPQFHDIIFDWRLFRLYFTVDKQSGAEAASSNNGMVIIVAALVGVLGTVAIGLTVAVVIIGRRRRYSAVNKGTALIVAEEM